MSIRTWINIAINSLVLMVIVVLTVVFYHQTAETIQDRILLQLNSIKQLKGIQIREYLEEEWLTLKAESAQSIDSIPDYIPLSALPATGAYDLSEYSPTGKLLIGMVKYDGDQKQVKLIDDQQIQHILLERTGMGETGETYLVGDDLRLRSRSRFFPDQSPFSIGFDKPRVRRGLSGESGQGIGLDYREVEVYTVYEPIELESLRLLILSEIDVSEAHRPLIDLRYRLISIALVILLIAALIAHYLTSVLTQPLTDIREHLQSMSIGQYDRSIRPVAHPLEIHEMYIALIELQTALSGAVRFSTAIGDMHLDEEYTPNSSFDLLGESLINMRDQLAEYQRLDQLRAQSTKRLLIDRLEQERRRLSRELHDGVGPLLTSLKLYVQNHIKDPVHQSEMRSRLDETISEIRRMSYALLPPSIQDFGIGATLSSYIDGINRTSDIEVHFEDLTHKSNSQIDITLAVNIYRIVQELINNTLKYAQATSIHCTLSELDDFVSLYYIDDGRGFDIVATRTGAGLTNIRERVDIFNGTIQIESKKGQTLFEIEIPLSYE